MLNVCSMHLSRLGSQYGETPLIYGLETTGEPV